eukprot:3736095-Amphidinium_carterae.1
MDWFDEMQTKLRTPRGIQDLALQLSSSGLADMVKLVVLNFCSAEFSRGLQFSESLKEGPIADEDDAVASAAFDLLVHAVGEWTLTAKCMSLEPPVAFVRLLGKDEAEVQACLAHLRSLHEALIHLEQQHWKNTSAMAFHRDLLWARNQWVREIMYALDTHDWKPAPHILEEIRKWSKQWFSTVIVENSLRPARKSESQPAGGHGVMKLYHHLLTESNLAPEYGRHSVESVLGHQKQPDLSDDFFEPTHEHHSLGEERVDSILGGNGNFPTMSSRNTRESCLRTECLKLHKGDWDAMSTTFLCNLVAI